MLSLNIGLVKNQVLSFYQMYKQYCMKIHYKNKGNIISKLGTNKNRNNNYLSDIDQAGRVNYLGNDIGSFPISVKHYDKICDP